MALCSSSTFLIPFGVWFGAFVAAWTHPVVADKCVPMQIQVCRKILVWNIQYWGRGADFRAFISGFARAFPWVATSGQELNGIMLA